ncbi:UNVERIFIED_CONTAM: hypothetical protein Sindi_2566000 [Sesamum indicum]
MLPRLEKHPFDHLRSLGWLPKQMKLIECCYRKKEDGGWSGPRVADVVETFQKILEDHQPQSTADNLDAPAEFEASAAMTEQQIWLAAIGGKKKDRVFGLGSEAHVTSHTFTSLSPSPMATAIPGHGTVLVASRR